MNQSLAPPTILGPVSACNTSVWLDGLVVSRGEVTAKVFVNNLLRATVAVTGTRMEVHVGFLVSGDFLQAQQTGAVFASDGGLTPFPTQALRVAGYPTTDDVRYPVVREHAFDCAMCATFEGLYPDATVTVHDAGTNAELGSARSVAGKATVQFAHTTHAIIVRQTACGIDGPWLGVQMDTQIPNKLPSPDIVGPMRDGQTTLTITDLYVGAIIELGVTDTSGTSGYYFTAGARTETIPIPTLHAGDVVNVQHVLPGCATGAASDPLLTLAMVPPAPKIESIVCAGDTCIRVSNLIPSALVFIYFYYTWEVLFAIATGSECDIVIPGWVSSEVDSVAVYQTLAPFSFGDRSTWSPPSDLVALESVPTVPTPTISQPLMGGGTLVNVINVPLGRQVVVEAQDSGDPDVWFAIGSAWSATTAGTSTVDVPVNAAFMSAGRHCRAVTISAGTRTVGLPVQVFSPRPARFQLLPKGFSDKPVVQTILDSGSIHVSNLYPGALIDVFRETTQVVGLGSGGKGAKPFNSNPILAVVETVLEWVGSFSVPAEQTSIVRPRSLRAGDSVVVMQRIDGLTSPASEPAAVITGGVTTADATEACKLTGASAWPEGVNVATDEGVPVEHNGQLFIFFGDAIAWGGCPKPVYQALGAQPCPRLTTQACEGDGYPFHDLHADSQEIFPFACCEPPTGGFSYDDKIYLFVPKGPMLGEPGSALGCGPSKSFLVAAQAYCPLAGDFQPGWSPAPSPFHMKFQIDQADLNVSGSNLRFINICARVIKNRDVPSLPSSLGDGLLISGTGVYGLSELFHAWVPLTSGQEIPSPEDWYVFTGAGYMLGAPLSSATPIDPLTENAASGGRELSVSFIAGLNRWLVLRTGNGGISALIGRHPSGPFEYLGTYAPFDVATPNDTPIDPPRAIPTGEKLTPLYGGYHVPRYDSYDPTQDEATVYFIASTLPSKEGTPCDPSGCTFLIRLRLRPPSLLERAASESHVKVQYVG